MQRIDVINNHLSLQESATTGWQIEELSKTLSYVLVNGTEDEEIWNHMVQMLNMPMYSVWMIPTANSNLPVRR